MPKRGRPKIKRINETEKVIDYKIVERLARVQFTQQRIAEYLGVSLRTLQNDKEFLHVYRQKKEDAKIVLLENQFTLAESNPTMAIWLGKQYLGQRDQQDEVKDNDWNERLKQLADIARKANGA